MSGPRLLWHQLGLEQRAFWRNPEAAFFTFALPVGLLLIFGFTSAHDTLPGRPEVKGLTLLVPGLLAFGIIVAAYGTLAATIAMLRADGVLKRIRATPLSPGMYLAGQLASVLVTSLVVAITTITLGRLAFGIAPRTGGLPALLGSLALGVVCFAALGIAVSALIPRADAAGAITNGTYLPLALVSGTFSTGVTLPGWLDHVVSAFPIKALTDSLRAGYDPASHGPSAGSVLVLASWTIIGIVLAHRYFRWEPSR
jgi:ABC-type multidrug transport system permease subunit